MCDKAQTPKTLIEAIRYFEDQDVCVEFVSKMRWPNGVTCPHCESKEVGFLKTRRIYKCKNRECRKQFSVKVGTIMEDSAINLDKWLVAMWLIANAKNGISSYEIARSIGVTQKSAWHLMHRIRLAMQNRSLDKKLIGTVEVDETLIGGKARNMHTDRRLKKLAEKNYGKTMVMGLLERHGEVRAKVVESASKESLQQGVREDVEEGSALYTDQLASYKGLKDDYVHEFVNHAETYVEGEVHTNGIENFWSLLKRGITGTYVSVEPWHLFRYLDEQSFRFNSRKTTDNERFQKVIASISGRRVTYGELTGNSIDDSGGI